MAAPLVCALIAAIASVLALPGLAAASSASHFAEVLSTPAPFVDPTASAARNQVVVLQSWETGRARQLKAAHPGLLLLAYQNLGALTYGRGPGGGSSSGVNYDEAQPSWFLREAGGAPIAEEGYPYLWMADIGEPGYQAQWTANVLKLLAAGPWDGVMMDDTNTSPRFHVYPQSRIAKYPDDASYQAAVRSMLAYAGPRIQAAGKLAIPNFGAWTQYPGVVSEWLQYVSGGEDEMFAKWSATPGVGYRTPIDWKIQLEEVQGAEANGKRFLAITQADPADTRAVRFGWASALIDGNGSTSFLAAGDYDSESWSSEYEAPIGEPAGAAAQIGAGAWARVFSNGLVLVNPGTAPVHVALGGVYSGDGLSAATEATLEGDSALILTRGAGTPAAPSAEVLGSGPTGPLFTATSGTRPGPGAISGAAHRGGAPLKRSAPRHPAGRDGARARCRARLASRAGGHSARVHRRAIARCVRAARAARRHRAKSGARAAGRQSRA
jgi:hypothetical protein